MTEITDRKLDRRAHLVGHDDKSHVPTQTRHNEQERSASLEQG